jgi:putative hydrolase of the HAD superfamily
MFDWGDTVMKDLPDRTTPMYQWPKVEIVEGAEEVLRRLHPEATIILATSATLSDEADIRRALHRVNIDPYFHRIYCFRNTGYKKPSQEFYTHILRDLDAKPSDVLMIGDSFENDIRGANRVGIRAIWLNQKSEETKKGDLYCTIHALRELLPLVSAKEKNESQGHH